MRLKLGFLLRAVLLAGSFLGLLLLWSSLSPRAEEPAPPGRVSARQRRRAGGGGGRDAAGAGLPVGGRPGRGLQAREGNAETWGRPPPGTAGRVPEVGPGSPRPGRAPLRGGGRGRAASGTAALPGSAARRAAGGCRWGALIARTVAMRRASRQELERALGMPPRSPSAAAPTVAESEPDCVRGGSGSEALGKGRGKLWDGRR